jgi:hypothetical protein
MRRLLTVVLALSGCFSPHYDNGYLACNSGRCPSGYYCASNDTCWKDGTMPTLDMTAESSVGTDLSPSPSGDLAPRRRHQGESCTPTDVCDTGNCVDGYCCDTACTDACTACNVSGIEGTCSPLSAGAAPVGARTCNMQPASTCGHDGTCDGMGRCRNYPNGTACSTPSCNVATGDFKPASLCDGNGACVATATYNCAPYKCQDTTQCWPTCGSDNTKCSGSNSCVNGLCGTIPNGRTCSANAQCTSGYCVDGYCCNVACNGQCEACDIVGSLGTCSEVSGVPHGSRTACNGAGAGSKCGGSCGTQRSVCDYAGGTTLCNSSCKSTTTVTDFYCDGNGACSSSGTDVACSGNLVCGGGACKQTCSGDPDCQTNFHCSTGTCVRNPESSYGTDACLDGIDNNGDGLADCADPTCNNFVECVPSVSNGTIGVLTGGNCPADYTNHTVVHQGLTNNSCTCNGSCSCSATSFSCTNDVFFSSNSSDSACNTVLTSSSDIEWSATVGSNATCQSTSQGANGLNATALEVRSIQGGAAPTCSNSAAPGVAAPNWSTTDNFCGISKQSSTCGGSQVCVAKTSQVCVMTSGGSCPAGYSNPSTWYTSYSDNRSCSCGTCSVSASCRVGNVSVYEGWYALGLSCYMPRFIADATGNTFCKDRVNIGGTVNWSNPIYGVSADNAGSTASCSVATGCSGSANPTGAQIICCQ